MFGPPPISPLFPHPPLSRSRVGLAQHVVHTRREARVPIVGRIVRRECDDRHPSGGRAALADQGRDRKSTRLNSSHSQISYAVFCLKKKNKTTRQLSCCPLAR